MAKQLELSDITTQTSRADHPATEGIAVEEMAFITPEDGLEFPHPGEIRQLTEDGPVTAGTSAPVDDADPENGVFMAMNATEVYEYLETMQKKSDWWLKNEIQDLKRRYLAQRPVKLSNPDKQWIVRFEMKRRAEEYGEWNPKPDSQGWQALPNAQDND